MGCLVVWNIIIEYKYFALEQKYKSQRQKNELVIDSLTKEDIANQSVIRELNTHVFHLEHSIDSLVLLKQNLKTNKGFVISSTLSESVKTLKQNLCEN